LKSCSVFVRFFVRRFTPGVLIDAAKPCWQHRCQNMEAGPMAR
jgi:hypothetical protein